MSSDCVIWLCLKLSLDVFRWMDSYSWMLILIQWLFVWVSFIVRPLSECIIVQCLAQFLTGFVLYEFSLLSLVLKLVPYTWEHLICWIFQFEGTLLGVCLTCRSALLVRKFYYLSFFGWACCTWLSKSVKIDLSRSSTCWYIYFPVSLLLLLLLLFATVHFDFIPLRDQPEASAKKGKKKRQNQQQPPSPQQPPPPSSSPPGGAAGAAHYQGLWLQWRHMYTSVSVTEVAGEWGSICACFDKDRPSYMLVFISWCKNSESDCYDASDFWEHSVT